MLIYLIVPDQMWTNICTLVYVTMETLMNIMALGVYGYKGTYLRSAWNQLDVFIYFALQVSLFGLHKHFFLLLFF